MNNKILFISLIISTLIHMIALSSFRISRKGEKTHYSEQVGEVQIRVNIQLRESVVEKRIMKEDNKDKFKARRERKPKQITKSSSNKQLQFKAVSQDLGQKSLIANYLSKIRKEIERLKYKNRTATRLMLKGRVEVSFNISWPNKLEDLMIITSSNNKALDNSAIESVRRISQAPRVPVKLKGFTIPVKLTLIYD